MINYDTIEASKTLDDEIGVSYEKLEVVENTDEISRDERDWARERGITDDEEIHELINEHKKVYGQ